jgi:hypothetical protein
MYQLIAARQLTSGGILIKLMISVWEIFTAHLERRRKKANLTAVVQ